MKSMTLSAVVGSFTLAGALAGVLAQQAGADEGMWLVNKPPMAALKTAYGFEPSKELMEHLQSACVNPGASGSFVSPMGLVMTNHHVASDAIAKLSTRERDLMRDGFYAAKLEDEIKCADTDVTMLVSIVDVTERVKKAGASAADDAAAGAARRAEIAKIEAEEQGKTGLKCSVVTLYQGGQYHLYCSKRFTDVRLVFCPEQQAAFYGGDTANFEFPRHDFDVTFLRVYEDGKPYQPKHSLKWSENGSKDGDLTLVLGHPGRTQRLLTANHLRFVRDVELPFALEGAWRSEMKLTAFANRAAENARQAQEMIFGIANGRKARTGMLAGLQDPAVFGRKVEAEKVLRAAIDKDAKLKADVGGAFEKISAAYAGYRPMFVRHRLVSRSFGPSLASTVFSLCLLTEEKGKPDGSRLAEFSQARMEATEFELYSPAPVYRELETAQLANVLSFYAEQLGAEDPLVKALLAGKSPQARAEECVSGTKLMDPAARKALVAGGPSGVRESSDPMVTLARALEPEYRALRTKFEDEVEAVERPSYAKIAAARFAVEGDKVYPDATGTLRFSYGPVKGYVEDGKQVAPYTTIGSLFETAAARGKDAEFDLPAKWRDAKGKLKLDTPMNFVCATDIIGGNSGSPVVNTKGEVIGLIFDGNIQSLPGAFAYDMTQNRAVAVDSRAIVEGLRAVYGAERVVKELLGK